MTIDPRSGVLRGRTGAIDCLSEAPGEVDRCVYRLARSMDGQSPSCRGDLSNELARFLKRRCRRGKVEFISAYAASAHRGRHAAVARAWGLLRRKPAVRAGERLDCQTRVLEPLTKQLWADRERLGRLGSGQVEDLSEDVRQPMRSVQTLQHAKRASDFHLLGEQ
jgi:hypothetical protein